VGLWGGVRGFRAVLFVRRWGRFNAFDAFIDCRPGQQLQRLGGEDGDDGGKWICVSEVKVWRSAYSGTAAPKPTGYTWSYSACRLGQLVPIWAVPGPRDPMPQNTAATAAAAAIHSTCLNGRCCDSWPVFRCQGAVHAAVGMHRRVCTSVRLSDRRPLFSLSVCPP
jgi:hypothetical protein